MADGDGPVVLRSRPMDGATEVDRGTPIRVDYDRSLDPRTVGRDTVSLSSGALVPYLDVRFDPVERAIVTRPFRGRPLEPSVRYTLAIAGVRDLDGFEGEPLVLVFETGDSLTEPPAEGTTTWEAVEPIFAAHCVDGCHDGGDGSVRLDLTTLEGARATCVGVTADQTGGTGTVGRLGLGGMARIEPSDPARSYLIYKMLGDPHAWGDPMPPSGALPRAEVALVADWILGGVR